jgi:hypothetical protein
MYANTPRRVFDPSARTTLVAARLHQRISKFPQANPPVLAAVTRYGYQPMSCSNGYVKSRDGLTSCDKSALMAGSIS